MPLFYVSCCDVHTGKFIGGMWLNAPTVEAAAQKASLAAYEKTGSCIETVAHDVPPGSPPTPADVIGKLLSRGELEAVMPMMRTTYDDATGELKPAQ